jgi:hypothetical protein
MFTFWIISMKKARLLSVGFEMHDAYVWACLGDLIVRFTGRFMRNFTLNLINLKFFHQHIGLSFIS